MKGLIIKDTSNVLKQLILFTICSIIMIILGFYLDAGIDWVFVVMAYLCIIFSSFSSISVISDDERCGFDKYIRVLPISKKNVIIEKYLLALLINITYIIIYCLSIKIVAKDYADYAKTSKGYTYATITLTLLLTAIILLLTIKFNVQKATLISVTVLPIIVVIIINMLSLYDDKYNHLEKMLWNIQYIFPVIAIVVYVFSLYMSSKIYLKKECN